MICILPRDALSASTFILPGPVIGLFLCTWVGSCSAVDKERAGAHGNWLLDEKPCFWWPDWPTKWPSRVSFRHWLKGWQKLGFEEQGMARPNCKGWLSAYSSNLREGEWDGGGHPHHPLNETLQALEEKLIDTLSKGQGVFLWYLHTSMCVRAVALRKNTKRTLLQDLCL